MSKPLRVLLADDSPEMLRVMAGIVSRQPDFVLVAQARDGEEAVALARRLRPDVLTLHARLPRLDAAAVTERVMAEAPCHILVMSEAPEADLALRALRAGALEVLPRPTEEEAGGARFGARLVEAIRLMSQVPLITRRVLRPPVPPPPPAAAQGGEVLGFGLVASTGGPPALATLLSLLAPGVRFPLFIAQHILEGFTPGLARSLAESSRLPVEVARAGMRPRPGHVYLPPDGHHLLMEANGQLSVERAGAGLCPSGDRLLTSLARALGGRAGGAVLTGMGRDGAVGLRALRDAGGVTFVQRLEQCVVPGMPKAALQAGAADRALSVEELASALRTLPGPSSSSAPPRR